jgi:hypothetical protein
MKLTKKQLSASYVTQATASTSLKEQAYPGGITKGDVANHRDYGLAFSSVARLPRQSRVHPISLRAVSEARRRDQSPEWQRRCPARFRYSDLNGAARVCGGRGQIMGFE